VRILEISERPSALLAACAQVSATDRLFALATAGKAAHAPVVGIDAAGRRWGVEGVQAQQIQMQGQLIRVQGTNGSVVKDYPTALQPVSGVRGAPPRGRPV